METPSLTEILRHGLVCPCGRHRSAKLISENLIEVQACECGEPAFPRCPLPEPGDFRPHAP
jgi:hypothetical protein